MITARPGACARAAACVAIVASVLFAGDAAAQSAGIRLLGSPAVRGAVIELARRFEAETGHRVVADYDVFGVLKRRIDAREVFDIAILSPDLIDELGASGIVALDTRLDLGRHGVGLAARKGLTLPDIRTSGALKQTLLAAESIAYFNEGTAGAHFVSVVRRLGIAAELRSVLLGYDTADLEASLQAGSIQYVAAGVATLRALPGVGAVAPLPDEFQSYTTYTAAVGASARAPADARAFLRYLSSSAARQVLIAHGLEPGTP